MPTYARYDPATGSLDVQTMPPTEFDEGCTFWEVADGTDPNTIVVHNGQLVEKAPRPGPERYWQFDPEQNVWFDPRTPEERAAEEDAKLKARRAGASLTRLEFAKRVSHPESGIIQPSSGMILLDGDVPPELEPMVASLPPGDQFDLIMDLKGASQFDRLNPFVIAAGHYLGLTDKQIDAVFGI